MAGLSDFVEDSSGKTLHIMNVEYEESFGEPIIHLFCRTQSGGFEHVEVEGFRPSFYIRNEAYSQRIGNHDWVVDVQRGAAETIHGEPLTRIYTRLPKHVGGGRDVDTGLREYFEDTWEADVFFCSRFLIDTGIHTHVEIDTDETWSSQHQRGDYRVDVGDIEPADNPSWRAEPRVITADIEVLSPMGFPEAEDASQPVSAITAHDNYDEDYHIWLLRCDDWGRSDTEVRNLAIENRPDSIDVDGTTFDVNVADVRVFEDESAMLDDFNTYVEERRPDLLSGWNSSSTMKGDAFDYPYLHNRCQHKNVSSFRDWSPMEQVWTTRRGREQNLTMGGKGVTFFDTMEAYKKTQYNEPKGGWGLANTSERELGMDEAKLEIEDIDEAWRHDLATFLQYNVRDVQAVLAIDEAAGVTSMYQDIRRIGGVQFESCHNSIDTLDVFIIRMAHKYGYALPTSEKPERDWYYGAHVFDPELGRHENVVYPDLWSMYPNIVRNCNMSPETMIGTKEDLEDSEYTEEDCRWTYIDTRPTSIKNPDDRDGAAPPEYEKLYFVKPDVQKGFMNEVIDDLMEMKDAYKGRSLYGPLKHNFINSCFTPDTEVLTPDGIRMITDIDVGDEVYSYDPETGKMETKSVVETIRRPEYDDELVHVENNSMDIKVTPDHRFLVDKPRHGGSWEYVEAGELNKWSHYETPNVWEPVSGGGVETIDLADYYDGDVQDDTIRCDDTVRHQPVPRYYDADDVIELVGWFISEGSVNFSGDEPRGDKIIISQYRSVNAENHADINELFDRMGLTTTCSDRQIEHSGSVWAEVLSDWCGERSGEKSIPAWVFEDCSVEQKELLRDTLMRGDGDSSETPKRYTTKSTELRDDFIRLVWETGFPCNYSRDSGVWRCFWRTEETQMSFRMHRDGSSDTADDGVYCVQVEDNHTLVAGRNGKFVNIPNCYGVFGDSDSYAKGYRLFDWRIAEGITLGGRKMIQDSSDMFVDVLNELKDEYGYEGQNAYRVGGDTDSVMTSIPFVDVDYDADGMTTFEQPEEADEDTIDVPSHYGDFAEIVDLAQEAADRVNEWYEDWTAETFNLTDGPHYCELEIESYAPRAFIPEGVTKKKAKKRYAEIIAWDEGVWQHPPEFSVTGIDIVRSDRAPVTRSVLEDVLDIILREDDAETARRRVYDQISDEVEAIESGEREKAWIARPKGMNKPPKAYGTPDKSASATYKGAKYANEYFDWENLTSGDKPALLYLERVRGDWPTRYPDDWSTAEAGTGVDAIAGNEPNQIPDEFVIDVDKQVEKVLEDPLTPILSPMNWSFDEALSDTEQTTLAEMM